MADCNPSVKVPRQPTRLRRTASSLDECHRGTPSLPLDEISGLTRMPQPQDNSRGTEPTPFWGQTAVQGRVGVTTGLVRASGARIGVALRDSAPATRRRALPLALGSVTFAVLAVTGARALEGPAPVRAAPVISAPTYVGGAAS